MPTAFDVEQPSALLEVKEMEVMEEGPGEDTTPTATAGRTRSIVLVSLGAAVLLTGVGLLIGLPLALRDNKKQPSSLVGSPAVPNVGQPDAAAEGAVVVVMEEPDLRLADVVWQAEDAVRRTPLALPIAPLIALMDVDAEGRESESGDPGEAEEKEGAPAARIPLRAPEVVSGPSGETPAEEEDDTTAPGDGEHDDDSPPELTDDDAHSVGGESESTTCELIMRELAKLDAEVAGFDQAAAIEEPGTWAEWFQTQIKSWAPCVSREK